MDGITELKSGKNAALLEAGAAESGVASAGSTPAASKAQGQARAKRDEKRDAVAFARSYIERSAQILNGISPEEVGSLIEILTAARDGRRQVFVCGNGGSAATASHFASGLGKDGSWKRSKRFRAVALTDNVSWITSLANDSDYADIFVEQLKNHAETDDVLVAFSASGNSSNILRAVQWANENGVVTVGITRGGAGELGRLARHTVGVGSDHTGHVEEAHFLIQHLTTYFFVETE